MPVLKPEALVDDRVQAICEYHRHAGQQRAEIDVSGGIDSAVIFGLLVRALGSDNVTAVFLGINSSADSLQRAQAVADALGARLVVDELGQEFRQRIAAMVDCLEAAGYARAEVEKRMEQDPTVLGSIRSCLRAPLGRGYNRLTGGGIRHGTGNECEDRFLRFYQKGGDGEVDTNPIDMLSKGEVYQLGIELGIPSVVLNAKPSPDLWGVGEQHSDESELLNWSGVAWTYSRVDPVDRCYRTVGSIERMSRYLDAVGDALFDDDLEVQAFIDGSGYPKASEHRAFLGLSAQQVEGFVVSAKKLEAQTRHKANPNIPSLGDRAELLRGGILTNDLPEISA